MRGKEITSMSLINYGNWEDLEKLLVGKRITYWSDDYIELDDDIMVEIEESEQSCCARAEGEWYDVELDAVITAVKIEDEKTYRRADRGKHKFATVMVYHNQNVIARANCNAHNGNGGWYYSVCSLVVKDVHYKVVEC